MRELDLHGLTVDDALKTFVQFYNHEIKHGSREAIRVVHGYGSSGEGGKIRLRLRQLLAGAAASLAWKPGEEIEGNLGVTIVYPQKVLLERDNQLAAGILEFCSTPRTESKIAAEFRTYDAREIKQSIRALLRQSRLREIVKSGRSLYLRSAH